MLPANRFFCKRKTCELYLECFSYARVLIFNTKQYLIMKKTIKGILFGGIASIIFACNTQKEEPAVVIDKEQIKKDIQAREDSFAAVYNSGVAKNIGYYADDATSYYQNREPL